MEYFWLKQDMRDVHIVTIKGLIENVNLGEISRGNMMSVPDFFTAPTSSSSEHNVYADVLSRQIFMVTRDLFHVLEFGHPNLRCKEICIMDSKNSASKFYYLPELERLDIPTTIITSKSNADKKYLQVAQADIPLNKNTFYLFADRQWHAVISLSIAEAILRRNFSKIVLERLQYK